jgi:hypothetical protein
LEEFKQTKKRNNIIKEILDTEIIFVNNIKQLIELILTPLKINTKIIGIEEKDLKEIFSNIEQIYKINSEFLTNLQKEYLNFPNTRFSNIFNDYLPYFKGIIILLLLLILI